MKARLITRRRLPVFLIAGVLTVVAGLVLYVLIAQPNLPAGGESGILVADARSYVGQIVYMQIVQPEIENGKIKIPLADVTQANIVGFTTANDQGEPVPIMVYIAPSGRLNASTAQCACGSCSFSLAGRAVVCAACRSTYDIENQSYLSGAAICAKYPLTVLKPVVSDGVVEIDQQEALIWRNLAGSNAEVSP